MPKVHTLAVSGELVYPECPYAVRINNRMESILCRKVGRGLIGLRCVMLNAVGGCPFDLHKELYGEDGE